MFLSIRCLLAAGTVERATRVFIALLNAAANMPDIVVFPVACVPMAALAITQTLRDEVYVPGNAMNTFDMAF